MSKKSAGLLLYRGSAELLEVLLVHPGGPFWAKKDEAAWSIPKGEFSEDDDPLSVARREFEEETGTPPPVTVPRPLEPLRQTGGKIVYAWALAGDFDPATLRSNRFVMEWPPKSGRMQEFPEVDRAAWFTLDVARRKILRSQIGFLDQLTHLVRAEDLTSQNSRNLKSEI